MKIDVFSIFPEMITGYTKQSILGRSIESGVLEVSVHDLRLATSDKHRTIDDSPFGGGAGMVLMLEPIDLCLEALKKVRSYDAIIYLTPDGKKLNQKLANHFSIKEFLFVIQNY